MNKVTTQILSNHLLSILGDQADNPLATCVRIYGPSGKSHTTTLSGIKHCQPKATVLSFSYSQNGKGAEFPYSINVYIKEEVDFDSFLRTSRIVI